MHPKPNPDPDQDTDLDCKLGSGHGLWNKEQDPDLESGLGK